MPLMEGMKCQRRETQLAWARLGTGSFWKMVRRMSVEEKAEKWELRNLYCETLKLKYTIGLAKWLDKLKPGQISIGGNFFFDFHRSATL